MRDSKANYRGKSGIGVPQSEQKNYEPDYIELPSIHPDPEQSISLTQQIMKLIKAPEMFQEFRKLFEQYDLQERYFFCLYCREYLSLNLHQTFLQRYFNEEEHRAEKIIAEKSNEKIYQIDSEIALSAIKNELSKREESNKIQQFIHSNLDELTRTLNQLYTGINQGNEFLFWKRISKVTCIKLIHTNFEWIYLLNLNNS